MSMLFLQQERSEQSVFDASLRTNNQCARAIDDAIHASCYKTNFYHLDIAVMAVVREYGFERVNAVLANHIQKTHGDARISRANHEWAEGFNLPERAFDGARLDAHAILVEGFARHAREMYAELHAERFSLPGREESGELNSGYEIIRAITFNDKCGYVIGRNPEYPDDCVTWQFRIRDGERVYNHGNYYGDIKAAADNYLARVAVYMSDGTREIPNPLAVVEITSEQNYNMIDGMNNNAPVAQEPPTPESAKEKHYIRFISSDYVELFSIPDGANIRVTYPPDDGREPAVRPCEYIDETHLKVGGVAYHAAEFASRMEELGAKYEPDVQFLGAELTPFALGAEKFFYRNNEEGSGAIGQMRGDFGSQGNRFFNNWTDTNDERKTPEFQAEFQGVVYFLRQEALRDYKSMAAFCQAHPEAKLPGDGILNRYGFSVETESRQYFVRLTTNSNDYFYVFAYDKTVAPVIEQAHERRGEAIPVVAPASHASPAKDDKAATERADGYTSVLAAIEKGKAAPKPPRKTKAKAKTKDGEEL